jgi:hypothetical protein
LLGFAPYLHKRPRANSITPDRQVAFVAALAASGIVTQAARRIGVSLEALYKLRNQPGAEAFSAAWDAAIDRGMARLEDCALERAIAGEERVIVRGGEVVATWRRYDTQLLVFLLKNRLRDRYGSAEMPTREEMRAAQVAVEREADMAMGAEEAAIYASIDAKLDQMRERMEAAEAEAAVEGAAAEAEAEEPVGAVSAGAVAEEVAVGGEDALTIPGIRLLPRLLLEGDKALGLPRIHPDKRQAAMIGKAYIRSRLDPPSHDEIMFAEWEAHLDAGRIGAAANAAAKAATDTA